MKKIKTPELDRLSAISEKSHIIGGFLEWLCEDHTICVWDEPGEYFPTHKSIEKLLAEYFNIDLKKVEKEKSALLDTLRKAK